MRVVFNGHGDGDIGRGGGGAAEKDSGVSGVSGIVEVYGNK